VLANSKYFKKHVCVNSDTPMTRTSYVTIKLPKSLAEQIDDVLERQNLGYTSRAELVKDAVRSFLAANKQDKSS
jgi:metal-responsive CopG/Arc/MetJ family transcriptional regulator